ncbi:hypothetical protein NUM3379_34700 [Kineococcus sp. NUM-3379]
MSASQETIRRIRQTPRQWADDVHAEVLRLLQRPSHEVSPGDGPVRVLRSWTAVEDGQPVLYLIYRHPWWSFTTGLRRVLDEVDTYPLDIPSDGLDPAKDLAGDLVTSDIEESLGRVSESMAPDAEGVWWWGHPPLPADENRRGPAPGTHR